MSENPSLIAGKDSRVWDDAQVDNASIVVFQDRTWFGDPRMGAFKVYVDGRKVGIAPVHGQLLVPVAPGSHAISVGQLWFRSRPVSVAVRPGSTTRLRAGIPLSLPLARRMALFTLWPRRCLVLEPTDRSRSRADSERSQIAGETARRGLIVEGIVGFIGALLVLIGVKVGTGLVVAGIVLMVAGTGFGIIAMLKARRTDSSKDKPA